MNNQPMKEKPTDNRTVSTKRLIQAGALCYVCKKAVPTRTDAFGGRVCQACFDHTKTTLLSAILRGGYHRSGQTHEQ